MLDPVLQTAQLDLQLAQLLLVILALEPAVAGRSLGAGRRLIGRFSQRGHHRQLRVIPMSPGIPPGKSTISYLTL